MYDALLITAGGFIDRLRIEGNLDALTAVVGGWIESVTLHPDGAHLYCHEEGKLEHLPVNEVATALVAAYRPGWNDPICGDVIVLGLDAEGNEADVPAHVFANMRNLMLD